MTPLRHLGPTAAVSTAAAVLFVDYRSTLACDSIR